MSNVVEYVRHGPVALLTIQSPPVNALGAAVRQGIGEGLSRGLDDAEVKVIVLTGSGRMFSAGADIREFGKPMKSPNLVELIDTIEGCAKPVIAALNGMALGGGLELAMGCHYRVAAPAASVGQPEVKLGIIPGAGGTQRLPRLAGVEAALNMIVRGDPVPAAEALKLGIVDELIDGDFVAGVIAFAGKQAGAAPRRTRDLDDKVRNVGSSVFEDFKKSIARRARGYSAPYRCIESIENAVKLPVDEGFARERAIFAECLASAESKALRHVFSAQRRAADIPDIPKDTPVREIRSAAVIGAGTMGGGIAMNFANAGIPVKLLETSREALDRGLEILRKNYAATVSKGRLTQEKMDACLALITPAGGYDDIAGADIVIEAVFEEMGIKKEVFGKLDKVCKPGAILATNTSTLDVDEIAAATARPESVIGTHFFSPANVMKLLEIVRGKETSKEVVASTVKLAKAIRKVGVVVGVCDGFVGNRMLHGYQRQANFMLEEGALPQQVDKVIHDFGFAMGPFAVGDLAGLDVGWRIRKAQAKTRPSGLRYSAVADKICEMGRFGQKTGAGWYKYEAGKRAPIPDPEIEALIIKESAERGIARRGIGGQEILERCIYALVNEGARILEEGIALRASDIDIIWLNGYGFPPYRGGPMFYADTVGLKNVYDAVSRYNDEQGQFWEPAPLLAQLAKEGKSFADYAAA